MWGSGLVLEESAVSIQARFGLTQLPTYPGKAGSSTPPQSPDMKAVMQCVPGASCSQPDGPFQGARMRKREWGR